MTDMTKGNPFGLLIRFVIPMLLSVALQQMYNLADSLVAGQMLGMDALAATGAAYPITALYVAIATGASIGCSVVISQLFGAKDMVRVRSAVTTSILSILVLAFLMMAAGELLALPLMQLMGTPETILADAMVYLRIYIVGSFFVFLYNAATATFNGLGDSKRPLYFLAFSTALNIALDILFVGPLQLGVAGLSWATLIAQGISAVLSVLTLVRKVSVIETAEKPKYFDRSLCVRMSIVAVPSMCQQSFISIGILMVQGLVNGFGADTIAAFSAALKISTFSLNIMNSLPTALSSYAAQNIGAEDLPRVRQGLRACIFLSEAVILFILGLIVVFSRPLLGLFLTGADSAAAIQIGRTYLLTVAPFYPLLGVKNCCDSVLRGGGAMGPFMATTFSDLGLRVLFAYATAHSLGFMSICLGYPIGWILGTALSAAFFFNGCWKPAHIHEMELGILTAEEAAAAAQIDLSLLHPIHQAEVAGYEDKIALYRVPRETHNAGRYHCA